MNPHRWDPVVTSVAADKMREFFDKVLEENPEHGVDYDACQLFRDAVKYANLP